MSFGGYLQANTAVDVLIGPFVDDTDGKTAETGLTLSQADIKLSKNGQALAQKNDDTAAAHDANGYYNCELDTTDTNTEGTLTLIVHESGALPVRHDFMVVNQAAYASLVTAKDTGYMDVNMKAVSEDTAAADNLESACDGGTYNVGGGAVVAASVTGAVGSVTGAVGSVTGNVGGNVTGSVGSVASGGITAASIATNAIDADALAADAVTEIWAGSTAPTAATIADAVWDEAATGHTDAGKAGAQVWTDIDAILADTGTDGVVLAADAITAAKIADDAFSAEHFATGALTADAFAANAITNAAVADDLDVNVKTITNGAITAAAIATNAIDADALAADAVTEIWAGSTAPAASAIADAVWDEAATGHTDAGKAGAQVWTDIDAILADTGTDGVVVASASKTGYSLTATTGLGNQTADITGNLSGSVGSVTGAVGSVTGNVGGNVAGSVASVTGAVGSVTGAVGSVTGNVGGNVTGSVGSVAAGGITAASIATGAIDADALAADAGTELADALLTRDLSAVTGEAARSPLNALRFLRNKWVLTGSNLSVKKEDDATEAWAGTVTTNASADPITGSDPA